MQFKSYQKSEIAKSMLETAIDLFLGNRCKFSALQLAANSEEVLAGLIKARNNEAIISKEKSKQWLDGPLQVGAYLNVPESALSVSSPLFT